MAKDSTLIELIQGAAEHSSRGYTFLHNDGKTTALSEHYWSFPELRKEAERRARYFRSLGLEKGDRLAMIVPEGEDFVLNFFGAVMAGVVPVPMYPPLALGKLDSYIDSAARVLSSSGAKMLLTTKQVSPIVWSLVGRVSGLKDLLLTEKVRDHDSSKVSTSLDDLHITSADPCFLQFTSGSTSDPKGVIVTHGNLCANAKAIMIDGLKSNGEVDKGVSWLPLYHDMGLIGFVIAPLFNGVPVIFLPTLAFVKRPGIWMETVSKYGGTITFAPNFAFGLATKRVSETVKKGLKLSQLRVLGCGAEPINAKTMRTFVETFAPCGFNPNALMPCYGMAEATLAIAFDDLSRPMTSVRIDRETYESEKVAKLAGETGEAIELVSVGQSFAGHEVAIQGPGGELLKNGEVGEIVFRGPSVTAGYFQNEEATRALLDGGWLHTGDLGFQLDGELYISGRKKDLIILNGRNYYPQAVEWEVEQIDGIRKGNAVAFAIRGENTEELVVVAETKVKDKATLAEAVKRHLQTTLGLSAKEVVLVGSGALPKTSSGKLQRQKTKHQFESGELGRLGNRTLGSTSTKVALFRHITMSAFARIRHTIKGSLPERARRLASAVRSPRQVTR